MRASNARAFFTPTVFAFAARSRNASARASLAARSRGVAGFLGRLPEVVMHVRVARHASIRVAPRDLVVLTRTADGFDRETVEAVRFVPMTGEAQRRRIENP